jgi:2-alkyl-3-oxoalkanoate reductase
LELKRNLQQRRCRGNRLQNLSEFTFSVPGDHAPLSHGVARIALESAQLYQAKSSPVLVLLQKDLLPSLARMPGQRRIPPGFESAIAPAGGRLPPLPDTLRFAMSVCVTGATGFLGGALLRRLLAQGISVRALARPSARADELAARGAEVVHGDLSDSTAITRTLTGVEIVYHVAAMVEAPGDLADFLDANRGGTERVFRAALEQNVRSIIYSSSIAVYGLARDGQVIDENTAYDDQPALRDSYSQSKIQADAFAVAFAQKNSRPGKLSVTILRPGLIYGPGKPLPLGLLGFGAGKTNVIFGNPNSRIPLNYIENLVDALLLAAEPSAEPLRQYIVLDDDQLTLAQYHQARKRVHGTRALFFSGTPVLAAARVAEATGLVKPGFGDFTVRQVSRALQNRYYETQRIRRELGWGPRVPLLEALRRSLDLSPGQDPGPQA